MSIAYELNIHLDRSRDYQRCLLLVYTLGLCSVWFFDYHFWTAIYLSLGILAHGWHLYRIGKPYAHLKSLRYMKHHWSLEEETGLLHTYQHLHVVCDFGWMMLLILKTDSLSRRFILFRDQLNDEQHRLLHFHRYDNITYNKAT